MVEKVMIPLTMMENWVMKKTLMDNVVNDGTEVVPGTPKRVWESPKLTEFGLVVEITKGISYLPLDGISNLT